MPPFPLISKACLVLVHMKNSQSLRHHESFSKITTILGWQSSNKPKKCHVWFAPSAAAGEVHQPLPKLFAEYSASIHPTVATIKFIDIYNPQLREVCAKASRAVTLRCSMHPAQVRRCIQHHSACTRGRPRHTPRSSSLCLMFVSCLFILFDSQIFRMQFIHLRQATAWLQIMATRMRQVCAAQWFWRKARGLHVRSCSVCSCSFWFLKI